MKPDFLSVEDVLEIHRELIAGFGGSEGIRDLGLLQSAVAMPRAGVGGQYLHTDLFEMAAACLFHVARNHPFVDGNKRVGAAAALVFLEINGTSIDTSNEALADMAIAAAEGRIAKSAIAEFFREHAA